MRNNNCFRREKGHATVLVVGGASEALNYDSEEIKYTHLAMLFKSFAKNCFKRPGSS